MLNLKINEEFKNLIPLPTEEEREGLEKSIVMFGCRDKIITWNNIIIDGHNRYEICIRNNIKFEVLKMDYDFENEEEVKQWIIKNQFARRNISNYQRSVLALQLKESIAKKAKENKVSAAEKARDNNPKNNSELFSQKSAETEKNNKPSNGSPEKAEENTESLSQKVVKTQSNVLGEPIEVIEGQVNFDESMHSSPEKEEIDSQESPSETDKIVKPIDTREEIAKIAGVSHDTIHKVEIIEKEAPEVIKDAAKENTISINKAYNITKEVKDLEEEDKKTKAEELLNQQYDAKAKQIDKQKKIADKIADVLFGILTTTIDEERIGYYLEYSPKEPLEKHINRCDEAIAKLQEVKSIFENMRKIKVVK